jgi:hypothetical protein
VVGSTNGIAGAYAAIFYGPIAVVVAAKSAAVKNADGSHSLLYCVESPESWFEDFGTGQLVGGKAQVKIDPAFAAVADLSEHHVFLTAYGNTNGLHVTDRSAQGFTVEEHNGGKNSLTFSYRIVGKRLAKVTLPTEPTRLNLPAPSVRAGEIKKA